MTRFASLSLILIAASVLAACSNSHGVANVEAERLIPVRVAAAESGPAAPPIRTTAVLAHKDELRLAFKTGGVIAAIHVDEGTTVKAGQLLAEVEQAEVGSQTEQARQMLAKAERDLARGERLHAEQVIALEQLQDLRTQRDMAAQAVKASRFNQEHSRIVAPADGVVLRKLAQARETVAPGSPVLVLGSADRGFVLKASLSDRDVVQLALDDHATVRFDALPGIAFDARVARLPAAADAFSGLFDVELALGASDPRLRSGLVARISLNPASAAAAQLVHVPIAALIEGEGDRAAIYRYQAEDHRVERRRVEVAFIDGERVALRGGLPAGALVVTDGAAYVADGRRVRLAD